jgi:curved DNA-binding protein CbpA
MADDGKVDYYEVLQVNASAEPDTIHRVYRLLAQRFHPDNRETGSQDRFQQLHEAYTVLSNPESRARYDIAYHQMKQDRWRLVAAGVGSEHDFELEYVGRLTVLEALYTQRRTDPSAPSLRPLDLESMLGRPKEHLEFTIWFLLQKKLVTRDDQSRLQITADGAEYLEDNYRAQIQRRRLQASNEP